jgi:hypothetical protein
MFGVNSDDTLVELYKYTRDTLVDYRNSISAIKQIIISDGLPFGESMNKLDEIFNVILKSKTQGDTINNFVQKSTEYEALLNKYKKLDSFTSKDKNNNLPEYRKMKSFLEDLWIIDLDKLRRC